MYGHVQEEVILKSSLAHYKNIIRHNGFPAANTSQQQCPHAPVHSSGRYILTKQPVVGFLSLVSSCMLITVCIIIYYAVKRHKIATKKWRKMVPVDSYSFNLFVLMVRLWQPTYCITAFNSVVFLNEHYMRQEDLANYLISALSCKNYLFVKSKIFALFSQVWTGLVFAHGL